MVPSTQTPLRRFGPPALALVAATAQASLELGTLARALVGGGLLAFWFAAVWRLGTRAGRVRGGPRSRLLLRAGLYAYFFIVVTTGLLGLLHALSTVSLTAAAAIAWALNPPGTLGQDERPSLSDLASQARKDPIVAILVLGAVVISSLTLTWAFLGPPYRLDDLAYHLTYPVEWALSGSLETRDILFGNHGSAWFPKTTELWFTWLFLPVGELFHLTGAQAPFLVGLPLVAFDLSRRLGASTRAGIVAATAMMLTPAIHMNLDGGYVDIPFAFFFLVTIDALFALRDEPGRTEWLELMGAVGLLLGTKVQAIPLLVFVLAPLGALVLWRSRPSCGRGGVIVGLVVLLAGGGWWYVRNYALSGNPFFPLLTEVFGVELFDGAYDRSDLPPGDAGKAWGLFDHKSQRGWALLTLAPYILGILIASSRPRERISVAGFLAVGVAIPLLLVLEYLVPWGYTRFTLPVLAVSVFALLPALESPRLWRATPLLILASALFQFSRPSAGFSSLVPPGQLVLEWTGLVTFALAIGSTGILVLVAQTCVRWEGRSRTVMCCLITALLAATAWACRETSDPSRDHVIERARDVWAPALFLEGRAPARVALCGYTASLPLYGIVPKHTVSYVPVNAPLGKRFFEQALEMKHRREELRGDRNGVTYYREGADRQLWNANLDEYGADFLVCYAYPRWLKEEPLLKSAGRFGQESSWAEKDPTRFRRVFSERSVRIYEILRP